jgi:hypothetical protein
MGITLTATRSGFGSPFAMSGEEYNHRGRSFWGDIQDGQKVNITKATADATDRFLAALEGNPNARVIVPIMDYINPDIIKAGILYDADFSQTEKLVQKAKMDLLDEIDNICAPENDIRKATTSTSTNLMHTITDQQVTVLFKKILPTQTLFSTVACKGKYAQWDAVTKGGTAYFDGEDPELVESDISDNTKLTPVKIMYSKGKLTKLAMLAGEAQTPARDLMAIRTMASNEMIKQLRERSFLGVNRDLESTTNAFIPAGSLQYAGLYELITGHTQATGTRTHANPNWQAATSWSSDTDPATCWRKYLEQDLNEVYRKMVYYGQAPDVMLTDYRTFSFIRTALNDTFRGNDNMVNTTFGISKLNIAMPNGIIPMIPIPFMPNVVGNGNIFMLNTETIEKRTLWPETFEELGPINTSKQYIVSAAECLIERTDAAPDTTTCLSMQGGVWAIPTLV